MSASEDSEARHRANSPSSSPSTQFAQPVDPTAPRSQSPGFEDPSGELHNPWYIDNDRDSDESYVPDDDNGGGGSTSNTRGAKPRAVPDSGSLGDAQVNDESYYVRPNRYNGHPATWRTWTEDDRGVAESLDHLRAQDLSVHLFNARTLRIRAAQLKRDARGKGKKTITQAEVLDEDDILEIPNIWVAWPMPPEEVPREHATEITSDVRPSREIEECLIAVVTKAARKRWHEREWEKEAGSKQEDGSSLPSNLTESRGGLDLPSDPLLPPTLPEGEATPGLPMFSSQAFEMDINVTPVPLGDDDKARRLLMPSTRHVISRFDDLLKGLHRARRVYATPHAADTTSSKLDSRNDAAHNVPNAARRRRVHPDRRRASSEETGDSETSVHSRSSKKTQSNRMAHSAPQEAHIRRLNLRDWSDVLGMASLRGWDHKVVERASERCARLFGEDMLFRTFYERDEDYANSYFTEISATSNVPTGSDEGFADGRESAMESQDDDEIVEDREDRHRCPVETCSRHVIPFSNPVHLQRHLDQRHWWLEDQNTEDKTNLSRADNQALLQGSSEIVCPLRSCPRNKEPFTIGAKLYLHVRSMHPEINVEALKKLESQRKGETRGKRKGEKRHRNQDQRK